MATVGEQLRTAREQQKLTIYQVAEITKIKTDHIRALETGNFEAFSAPVYIRGFARTYAKALKLNELQIINELEQELALTEKHAQPPPLTEQPRTVLDFVLLQLARLNRRWLLAMVVAVGVGLVALVQFRSCVRKDDPLSRLGPGIYQPTQHQSGEVLPLPSR